MRRSARSKVEQMLLGVKPAVDRFHAQKKGKSTKYPVEVRNAVLEAWQLGMSISRISKLLGIKLSTISAWRSFLSKKESEPQPITQSVKGNLRELKIVPDEKVQGPNGGMIQVYLPNKVMLQIPSQMVGLELLKGLMALETVCS